MVICFSQCVIFEPKSKFIGRFVSAEVPSTEKDFWNVLGIKAFSRIFLMSARDVVLMKA
jgi:hypothetical protein